MGRPRKPKRAQLPPDEMAAASAVVQRLRAKIARLSDAELMAMHRSWGQQLVMRFGHTPLGPDEGNFDELEAAYKSWAMGYLSALPDKPEII